MYYPEMKARVGPVQSIEPHRILAPTRDSNQEPSGSESVVVTIILPLHTDVVEERRVMKREIKESRGESRRVKESQENSRRVKESPSLWPSGIDSRLGRNRL